MKFLLATFIVFFSISGYSQIWENAGLANKTQRDSGYIGGEGGQWLQALAIDNTDGMVLLHGSDVGGVWRSVNGGQLWEPANNGYTPRGTCGIFIDPNNPARAISVGSNSNKAFFSNYHGLYMTTDTAKSWKQVLLDNNSGYRDIREQIAYDPTSFDTIKAYSTIVYYSRIAWTVSSEGGSGTLAAGLYKSVDGGSSWKVITNSKNYGSSIIKVHPGRGYVFAANGSGFFISKDQGTNFVNTFNLAVKGFDISKQDPGKIFLCTTNKIYVSSDTGATFSPITSTGFTSYANYLRVSPADDQYMITQHANPSDPWNTYYLVSHNGGSSWTKTTNNSSLNFLPANYGRLMYPSWDPADKNKLFSVGGDFITSSTDGCATLGYANNGASALCFYGNFSFNLDNPDLIFIPAQDYDASVSLDGGYTYKYLNMSGNGWGGDIHGGYTVDSMTWFGRNAAGWQDLPSDIKITFNGGLSYVNKGKSGGLSSCYGVPGDRNVLFAGDMRSGDKGVSWTKMTGCSGVLTSNPSGYRELYGVYNSTNIVKSSDKGLNWDVVAVMSSAINDLAYGHVDNAVYASCYTGGLWKVYVADSSVIDLTAKTPADKFGTRRFSTVAVDPNNPEIVYSGGTRDIYSNDVGVIRSVDGGNTWIPLTVDPRHNNSKFGLSAGRETSMIRVNPHTGYAWCGSSCYGLWKIAQPDFIPVPVPTMRLNQSNLILKQNDTFQLKSRFKHTEDTLVTWKSSNTAKVTVDGNGLVTAIAVGNATITATSTVGGLKATCAIVVPVPKGPYGGTIRQIPGKIEAEDFDLGGEGVGFHDASLANEGNQYRTSEAVDIETCGEGGNNIGWLSDGEWLSYTVNVDSTMDYDLEIRAAVSTTSKINLTFSNGNVSTGDISMAASGGWQAWKTFTKKGISLNKGVQEMRVNITLAGFNLNYLKLNRAIPVGVDVIKAEPFLSLYPNPWESGSLFISVAGLTKPAKVDVFNELGTNIFSESINNEEPIRLERSYFKSGIYFVKYSSNKASEILKLIVR